MSLSKRIALNTLAIVLLALIVLGMAFITMGKARAAEWFSNEQIAQSCVWVGGVAKSAAIERDAGVPKGEVGLVIQNNTEDPAVRAWALAITAKVFQYPRLAPKDEQDLAARHCIEVLLESRGQQL